MTEQKKEKSRFRGWCFTLNNYTQDDIEFLRAIDVDYVIFGKEIGKKGTPHLQGFLYIKKKITMKSLKRKMGKKYHLEEQKGNLASAICYCMKDNDYEEVGDRPRQGKRSDLDIIKHDIINGVSDNAISNKYFGQWCQYRRAFKEYRDLIEIKYDTELIMYDPSKPVSCKRLQEYMKCKYLIIDVSNFHVIWLEYYSCKYKYILCSYQYLTLMKEMTIEQLDENKIKYINIV